MEMLSSLRGYFLVAMPSLHNGPFERSVVYVCEHQPGGAVGLIVNQPLQYPLSFMFEQLHIESGGASHRDEPLLFGGPVQPERGFVIHRPCGAWRSSMLLEDDVTITTSNDIIRAIARDDGPEDALVALGFVAWGEGELDVELDTRWLACPYQSEVLYDVPFEKRWEEAALGMGIDMNNLVSGEGHA